MLDDIVMGYNNERNSISYGGMLLLLVSSNEMHG